MRRGTNLPAIGGYNQTVVLDLIRRSADGVSRVELAATTGLSAQTVSNVSRRLLDEGLVREAGKRIDGPGKPRIMLELDPRGRYAVGVHLDPAVITYVVLDLRGEIVTHSRSRTPVGAEPAAIIREMAESVEAIISEAGVSRERILGVGIAAPGPIDLERGVVIDPPLLEGWHQVRLRDELAAALSLPVLIEKDVTAAVVAERWMSGDRASEDVAFVYYGTGMGIGFAVGGDVVRGSSGNAGDAGHIVVQTVGDPAGAAPGPVCSCGRRGCVGELVMPRHLVERAVDEGILEKPSARGVSGFDAATVDRMFGELVGAATDDLDSRALVMLDDVARHLASAIVIVVNLLDVDRVVFGGPFWGRIEPLVMRILPGLVSGSSVRVTEHPILVESSAIGDDVAAVGAACLVLDDALSPRASSLLIR